MHLKTFQFACFLVCVSEFVRGYIFLFSVLLKNYYFLDMSVFMTCA